MNKEEIDFIKLIDGYTFYRYDYADFLYKNLKERDDKLEEKDKEIQRLNNIIDEIEDYLSRFLYMLNGITDRDIYEQCQLDDFTQVLDKLKDLKGE